MQGHKSQRCSPWISSETTEKAYLQKRCMVVSYSLQMAKSIPSWGNSVWKISREGNYIFQATWSKKWLRGGGDRDRRVGWKCNRSQIISGLVGHSRAFILLVLSYPIGSRDGRQREKERKKEGKRRERKEERRWGRKERKKKGNLPGLLYIPCTTFHYKLKGLSVFYNVLECRCI